MWPPIFHTYNTEKSWLHLTAFNAYHSAHFPFKISWRNWFLRESLCTFRQNSFNFILPRLLHFGYKKTRREKKNGLNLACARVVDIVITGRVWPYKSTVCASRYASACVSVSCGVFSFVRSLRDAQVYYNVCCWCSCTCCSYLSAVAYLLRYAGEKNKMFKRKAPPRSESLTNFAGTIIPNMYVRRSIVGRAVNVRRWY